MEVFPPNLLNSLPGAVDEDLVLKTIVSADLHCELQAVSVESVANVGVVSSCELVRAHQLLLAFLQFSKLKRQDSWEAHRFFTQHTPDLLPNIDRALVVEQRLHQPRLSEQLALLFGGRTFEKVNFEMGGEVKGLVRFLEQSDGAEDEAEVILFLHTISVDRIMCYNATAESERFDFGQLDSKHCQSLRWHARGRNLLKKERLGVTIAFSSGGWGVITWKGEQRSVGCVCCSWNII